MGNLWVRKQNPHPYSRSWVSHSHRIWQVPALHFIPFCTVVIVIWLWSRVIVVVIMVVCGRAWSSSDALVWTSCQCVDGLVGCVEGLLSGGSLDRVSWSWRGLGTAGHLVDGLLSGDVWSLWTNKQGSDSKRKCVWRSGVGTDEVAYDEWDDADAHNLGRDTMTMLIEVYTTPLY
ncbi:hypothetical protein V8E52_006516 [Russula decolorans]